ncbi:MAG: PD40 domain-containing protein, partial [Thermoflexales bacterium]|nr:PD40 domain-containing protein [Thermoflexales bacterium]
GLASIAWSPDGCQLHLGVGNSIFITDLHGNVLQKVSVNSPREKGVYMGSGSLSLSLTNEWIAYTVLSGYQKYSGAEFQNIEVVAVDSQTMPFVLTTRGGAGMAAWSPNGERLAYSDYDAAGVAQLYHSNPDGSDRVQLTHFTEPGTTIGMIRWSPAGKALTFAVYLDDETGSLWIASAGGTTQLKTAAESGNPITDEFWWDEDGQRLAFHTERSYEGDHAIYWIDAIHGQVVHLLQASETPPGAIVQPFPFKGIQTMGFVGSKGLIFYDMSTGATNEKEYAVDWNDLTGPVRAAPGAFQGEVNCPR